MARVLMANTRAFDHEFLECIKMMVPDFTIFLSDSIFIHFLAFRRVIYIRCRK